MSLCGLGQNTSSPCRHGICDPKEYCLVCKIELMEKNLLDLEARTRIHESNIYKRLTAIDNPSKKPYKCPVCDGTRSCHTKEKDLSWQCESCEGKGIVWG